MNRIKYLLKNMGFLAASNFSTKLLSFFLLPLYTTILTTSEYGTYDIINTTVSLLVPILTIDIGDAVLRFSMDKTVSQKEVLSISFKYYFISVIGILALLYMNHSFSIISTIKKYEAYLMIFYLFYALSGILSAFARGQNCVKETAIASGIGSALTIMLNVLFLVVLKKGLDGYFQATILGLVLQTGYLFYYLKCWRYLDLRTKNFTLEKQMVSYSRPLIINNIAWWVNNASDRYVVTYFCGLGINGIYSVGYKIPTILNLIQSIFHQAWMLSAVKESKGQGSDSFFSEAYRMYHFFLVGACLVIILLNRFIANFLYAEEFYEAWKYVPYLSMGFVFMGISNFIGGMFQAIKKPRIIACSTFLGAFVNLILDIMLTPFIGAVGAALATSISYVIVWWVRIWAVKKFWNLYINLRRDCLAYLLLFLIAVLQLYFDLNMACVIFILIAIIILHLKELNWLFRFIQRNLMNNL